MSSGPISMLNSDTRSATSNNTPNFVFIDSARSAAGVVHNPLELRDESIALQGDVAAAATVQGLVKGLIAAGTLTTALEPVGDSDRPRSSSIGRAALGVLSQSIKRISMFGRLHSSPTSSARGSPARPISPRGGSPVVFPVTPSSPEASPLALAPSKKAADRSSPTLSVVVDPSLFIALRKFEASQPTHVSIQRGDMLIALDDDPDTLLVHHIAKEKASISH